MAICDFGKVSCWSINSIKFNKFEFGHVFKVISSKLDADSTETPLKILSVVEINGTFIGEGIWLAFWISV